MLMYSNKSPESNSKFPELAIKICHRLRICIIFVPFWNEFSTYKIPDLNLFKKYHINQTKFVRESKNKVKGQHFDLGVVTFYFIFTFPNKFCLVSMVVLHNVKAGMLYVLSGFWPGFRHPNRIKVAIRFIRMSKSRSKSAQYI